MAYYNLGDYYNSLLYMERVCIKEIIKEETIEEKNDRLTKEKYKEDKRAFAELSKTKGRGKCCYSSVISLHK
jgi:hypothetical protein